jgi:Flp pilus assembly protein TadG
MTLTWRVNPLAYFAKTPTPRLANPSMYRASRGAISLAMTSGLLITTLMVGSVAIDTGVYFSEQKNMQNAADAAALAGTMQLFRSDSTTPSGKQDDAMDAAIEVATDNGYTLDRGNINFGYSDPTGSYNANTFNTANNNYTSTGGYNAVRVILRRGDGESNAPISTFLSQTFGHDGMASAANATAIYGGAIQSASGLRPVYLCQGVYDKAKELYGDPTLADITLYDSSNGNNGHGNPHNAGYTDSVTYDANTSTGGNITFSNATINNTASPLGDDSVDATDTIQVDLKKAGASTISGVITLEGTPNAFTVTNGGSTTVGGFTISLTTSQAGKRYVYTIASTTNTLAMNSIKFTYGSTATITGPSSNYCTSRTWNETISASNGGNVAIGNQQLTAGESCGDMPPGSFGFADFSNNNGSPGVPTVRGWWQDGYSGQVSVGNSYQARTGNELHAYDSEIDELVDNGTVFMIPLYDSASGNGSNATFHISGIVPFVITDNTNTGNPKSLSGHFDKLVCHTECQTATAPTEGYGVTKLRLVH